MLSMTRITIAIITIFMLKFLSFPIFVVVWEQNSLSEL